MFGRGFAIFLLRAEDPGAEVIAALVASCGCCNIVSPVISMFIGFVGAVLALLCEELLIRLQIDDPVGAVSVHGPPGVWGALAVAFFAEPNCQSDLRGLFYGAGEAGWELLAVQLFGVISMAAARWDMSGPVLVVALSRSSPVL